MKEYGNLAALLAKIEARQKGKEGMPEFGIGEQLKDIARAEPASAELIDQDLDKDEMSLEAVAEEFKNYADELHKEKKGSCICITPQEAEDLIRKFYGLPERKATPAPEEKQPAGLLDLESFL